jgi:REP element-mobilizing transposase RayT
MWKGTHIEKKPFDPYRYRRKTIRLPNHDYTWTGAYFITIHAQQHEPIFEIPELRALLLETWQNLPTRFPGVSLDEFVVMPDHVHFILWLDGTRDNAPLLGRVVGAYKSLTTVQWLNYLKANDLAWPRHLWQRNYYERVIRDTAELEQKRQYIRDNPTRLKRPETGDE